MRYEKGRRDTTRARILETASRRFRQDGVAAAGLTGIMADAGLTNGAFYLHFASKADLVGEALADAMTAQRVAIEAAPPTQERFEQMVRSYLSPAHRDQPGSGCPSAALLPEVGRADAAIRARYTEALAALAATLAERLSGGAGETAQGQAMALFGLLVGTMQLARAVDDARLSDAILEGGVQAALGFWPEPGWRERR